MKNKMRLAVTAAALTMLFGMQAFAGNWKQYGVTYTYYDGTPGNPGAVCDGTVRETGGSGDYEFLFDGKVAKNRWLGIQREGESNIFWTYFDEKGRDFSGWKQIDGNWYYFGAGRTESGWHRIALNYYYFDPVTNIMKTSGTEMRDGIEYYFDPDGVSWIVGGLREAGENGTEGWKQENEKWYYLRGGQKVVNEWLQDVNDKYFVGEDGARYTDWHEIDGVLYCFRGDGKLIKDRVAYENDHKYSIDGEGRATEVEMTAEEKMEHSGARQWCQFTYAIYTRSQDVAKMSAQINNVEAPGTAELLQRDWGITTKEQGIETINRLADAGRTGGSKSDKAWNFSRAMLLCESMQDVGWVTLAERLDMQLAIAPDIQRSFSSWKDFNDSYMTGFRSWATDSRVIEIREYAYYYVKDSSSYLKIDWNRTLEKTW